jgi:hypothetical protein
VEQSSQIKLLITNNAFCIVQRATAQSSQVKLLITNNAFSNQVKLLITNNSFCIVQRAAAQSKTGIFRDNVAAEAPPGFQAGWSYCMYFFSLFLFILFAQLELIQPRHSSP